MFSLMRKSLDLEFTNRPLHILSAFQRDSLPGMIYIEARSAKMVQEACNGLVGIYPSRGINLVPIEEMSSLLQIKKQDVTVTPGSWVRIRRGKYQGDLAQVMDITENGEEVGLKFIPRIDLNPKDEPMGLDNKKRKKQVPGSTGFAMRPPQRFFNYEEVVRVYGRKAVSKRNQVYVFQNDTYKDGFIEKDFKISALQLDDVNPTLDEITQFTRGQDGADNEANVDLSIIAEASKKAAIAVLQPGDHVEVFEGEQAGVHGTVHAVEQDVVTIQPVGVEFDGQRIQIPARSVRKRFKAGDHVKVMTGKNADETGLVVSVMDNVVTFLSDMTMQEVSVFSKDLREAAEVGTSTNTVGNYELHDLVQLDLQTVGVIFKTERDSFRVLDQNGQVRLVKPHQISMRRDTHRAIAVDSEGLELRVNDNVKEVEGEGRKGRVLHTHQAFYAWLFNRDYAENGGVFVTRARSLASLTPRGGLKLGNTDLSKMNPALSGGAQGGMVSGNMGRGPRDRLIGTTVQVISGPQKGIIGIVKDTNGNIARVELSTGNKIIMIPKEKLKRRNPDGSLEMIDVPRTPLSGPRAMGAWGGASGGGTPNPYRGGARTANPYAGSQTPAWGGNLDSRTPNPHHPAKTPAWNANAKTPNPYGGDGKTPAWSASSRTPNPYAAAGGWGGATPKPPSSSWGGATPAPNGASSSWGGATPARPAWGGATPRAEWGESSTSWSAPTPSAWGAPTPGMSAPTPGAWAGGAYGAPTPGVSSSYDDVRTPAAFGSSGQASRPAEEVIDDKWLLHPHIADKPGLICRIQDSFSRGEETGWMDGNHEGELVGVLSVFDAHNDRYTSRARIRFVDKPNNTQVPEIPVKYLRPVHPENAGEDVVILYGEHKGYEAKVKEIGENSATVILTGTYLIVEASTKQLCKRDPSISD